MMNNIPENIITYLHNQRWCNFKSEIKNNTIENISFNSTEFDQGNKLLVIGKAELKDQEPRYFMMPLAKASFDDDLTTDNSLNIEGTSYVDAVQKPDFWSSLINHLRDNNNKIEIPGGWKLEYHQYRSNPTIENNLDSTSKPLNVEQSNSTVVVGNKEIAFKLERMLSFLNEENPELEMNAKLMQENCSVMPQTYGHLTLTNSLGQQSSSGIIQEFVVNKGDMWNYSLAYLQEKLTIGYLRQTDLTPQNCPEFMDLVATLGNKTEEMSNCLSQPDSNPAFSPVPVDDKFIRNYQKNLTVLLYQSHRNIEQNIDNLPKDTKIKAQKLLSNWDSLTKSFINKQITRLNSGKDRGYTCRVHGDFHLGQVMVTKDNDLRFIDFAGEPGLPIEQRKEKHIYIRDYAGMYRSITGYLGAVAAEDFAAKAATPEEAASRKQYAHKALSPLIQTAGRTFLGKHDLNNPWLSLEVLRKNLYEVNYEVCNRPQMAYVPINGLVSLLGGGEKQNSHSQEKFINR